MAGGLSSGRRCRAFGREGTVLDTNLRCRAPPSRITGARVRLDEACVGVLFERAGEPPQQRAREKWMAARGGSFSESR